MTPPPRWGPALVGVLAAALALSVTELLGGLLPGGQSMIVAVGGVVIDATPGRVVSFAISTFGGANRLVLATTMAMVIVGLAATVGRLSARRWWLGPTGFGLLAGFGMAAGLADPLVPTLTALLAPGAGALVGVGALHGLLGLLRDGITDARTPAAQNQVASRPGDVSRRAFIGWAGTAAGAAAVLAVSGRALQQRAAVAEAVDAVSLPGVADPLPPPPEAASIGIDGVSPLITPNDAFFRIDSALTIPRIDPEGHAVRFSGMVDHPFEITYAELVELAATEADVTLSCVSNEVGGRLVGNARWRGVPLADLLDRAGVHPDATQVVGRSVDHWTGGFPIEAVRDGRPALVAVGMNGEPLPARHGFPVRLVIAGLYGYVSDTKWLAEVELTTFEDYDAYWIRRGWAQQGPIKTQSRIDVPANGARVAAGTVAVAGVAWAGERGVAAVEVSVDGGDWQTAELAVELAATSWRQWVLRWQAPRGEHTLRVRATDGSGATQTAEVTPPAPDGATGHHTINVVVT